MNTQPVSQTTAADYLARERRSESRHEFMHGVIRARGGAWRFNPAEGLEGEVRLVTAEARLPLREVYDKVSFPAESQ